MAKEFEIKLTNGEHEAIRDHLQMVLNLDRQMSEIHRQKQREHRSLYMAWTAAFYRNAKELDLPAECPSFIQDGKVAVTIEPDGTARWSERDDG